MKDKQKITISDIAKYCGVSATTVSRAINGTSYVSEGVKKQILEYIGDCGWQYGSLRHKFSKGRKSLRVALIVNNWFMASDKIVLRETLELQSALREVGFESVFTSGSRHEALQNALNYPPSLIVVNAANDRLDEPIRKLCEAGIPVITLGNSFNPPCPAICHDYESAGMTAARFLMKDKPERIGVLAGFGKNAHPASLAEIPDAPTYELTKGITKIFPGFQEERDLVSDCFSDYSEFHQMLLSGKYDHWIVSGTQHYLAFAKYLDDFSEKERKKINVIPLLTDDITPVPPYFQQALIRSSLFPSLKLFLKKNPSGKAEPQKIKVLFHQNGK
jgi:transcriptional regulator with XRE-family HTH domain